MLERMTVVDRRAATTFAQPRTRAILFLLIAKERSLLDLNSELGISLSLLHYHVGKLVQFELIARVRQQARSGRPVTIYRATARSYFVPAAIADKLPGAQLATELSTALERATLMHPDEGILYALGENGVACMQRLKSSEKVDHFELWMRVAMTSAQIRQFEQAVRGLLVSQANEKEPGARSFLCHVAVARTE